MKIGKAFEKGKAEQHKFIVDIAVIIINFQFNQLFLQFMQKQFLYGLIHHLFCTNFQYEKYHLLTCINSHDGCM